MESARSHGSTLTRGSERNLSVARAQHRFGKVDPDHPSEPGSSLEGKSDQPAVAAPEVEHRSGFGGQHRLEDFFPSQPGR